jgi:hypothetical protein
MIKNKYFIISILFVLIISMSETALAAGLFGPPQTVSREAGGLNTAIGYAYHEDNYKNGTEYIFRQNQIYTQVAYGGHNIWEIYGRVGISDLKIFNAFSSTVSTTSTTKNDFEENWKFFGTLGAKGFLPINKIFGIGAFIQGTYYSNYFTDGIAGTDTGTPFNADLKVKNMWDVNFGIGMQATIPYNIKLYAGPYVYYSEAKVSLGSNIPGLPFGLDDMLMKNSSLAGGFVGADIPLLKGFHLNIEGQYSSRFSAGAAISYTY